MRKVHLYAHTESSFLDNQPNNSRHDPGVVRYDQVRYIPYDPFRVSHGVSGQRYAYQVVYGSARESMSNGYSHAASYVKGIIDYGDQRYYSDSDLHTSHK